MVGARQVDWSQIVDSLVERFGSVASEVIEALKANPSLQKIATEVMAAELAGSRKAISLFSLRVAGRQSGQT